MESQTTECTTSTDHCGELTVTVSLKGLYCNTGFGCQTQQPTDPCPDPVDPDPVDPANMITTTEARPFGVRNTIVEADKADPWGSSLEITADQVFSISPDQLNLQIRGQDYELINNVPLPIKADVHMALAAGGPDGNIFYFGEDRQVHEITTGGANVGPVCALPTTLFGTYKISDLAVDTNGDVYVAQGRPNGITGVHKYTKSTDTISTAHHGYTYTTATGSNPGGAVAIHPDTGNFWLSLLEGATGYLVEFEQGDLRMTETGVKHQVAAHHVSNLQIIDEQFYISPQANSANQDVAIYGEAVHSVIMDNIGTLVNVGDTFVIHPQETTVTVNS